MFSPATNGAIIDPILDTIDDAPIAMLRATVGKSSDVYMYLKQLKPYKCYNNTTSIDVKEIIFLN